ncbi:MAG: YeiH family putative sulfate export transporter [Fretibacterium sp.]|nr:YeiH family putative sulfate export transporter [Fretibacterium sp.]
MAKLKVILPGLCVCFLIALLAWYCGKQLPIIGGAVFGILFGMFIALFKDFPVLKEGTRFASKKILQLSVILLGFEMDMKNVLTVGSDSLVVMLFTLTTAFITAWLMAKLLKIDPTTATLIGVGTSICGGSAIAATAPILKASDKEIAHSISTIFLFNVVAVFIFPGLGRFFNMTDQGFGIWTGTAVNDTSSVLAAGYAFSDAAGKLATIVKLTRTLMIVPIAFVLSLWVASKSQGKGPMRQNVLRSFPWFVLGFVAAAILNSIGLVPPVLSAFLAALGKFCIIVAMSAIGLNTHLGKLLANGLKPILLGLVCWVNLAIVSLIVQHYMGLL